MAAWPDKDPTDVQNYGVDWSDRVDGDDVVLSADWTLPGGLVAERETLSGKIASLWLSGGEVGLHAVRCRVRTSQGRTIVQTVALRVIRR